MAQVDDVPAKFEREVRKHLPEDYVVFAGREENRAGYVVNVWRLDPKKDVQGLEDIVCRARISYEDVVEKRDQDGPGDHDAYVILLTRLWQDLESRRLGVKLLHLEPGITLIESDKPPDPLMVHRLLGRAVVAPSPPSPSWWRRNWLDVIKPRRKPFIDPNRRGYW